MIYTCRPSRFGVYVDDKYPCSTAAEVRALTGADAVCNGWLFNMATGASCCNIKVGGRVLSRDPCAYLGYGWDDGKMPEMTLSMDEHDNFISCVALVNYGVPCEMHYGGGLAGRRGRTAIGFKKDGTLVMLCTSDRSGPLTMEELQSRMLEAGCETALALDGGGSSQCDTPAGDIVSSRAVPYFICVWTDDDNREESKPMAKYKVCLDAGHGGRESWNGSPDGGYKEHIGVLDIAKRTRDYLETAGEIEVIMTREEDATVELATRAAIANAAKADVYVSLHTNAAGSASTDAEGWSPARGCSAYTYGAGEGLARNRLANAILARLEAAGVRMISRPLQHNSTFAVLAQTTMPAVLMEYAFHTNREDAALLLTEDFRDTLAFETARGICDHIGVKAPERAASVPAEPPVQDNTPAAWEAEAVEWAVENGIIAGDDTGSLALHSTVTKAQAASMLYRYNRGVEELLARLGLAGR